MSRFKKIAKIISKKLDKKYIFINILLSGNSSVGRALPCQGRCRGFESRFPLFLFYGGIAKWLRRRSAKPLFPGSNPGAAFKI